MSGAAEPATNRKPTQAVGSRAQARRRHWHTNLYATAAVLAISAFASFGPPIAARSLKDMRVDGLPLPFYMGAQGAIIVYVVLVAAYAVVMRAADRRLATSLAALPPDAENAHDHYAGPADPLE